MNFVQKVYFYGNFNIFMMRLCLYPFFLFFIFNFHVHAQINNLSDLSQGEFISFSAIFDQEDDLFGYVAQFDLGETSKLVKTFEVIVYDKNLNRLFFEELTGDTSLEKYKFTLNEFNEIEALPQINLRQMGVFNILKGSYNHTYYIDVKTGEINTKVQPCFLKNKLILCDDLSNKEAHKIMRKFKKENKFYSIGDVEKLEDGNFLVKNRRTKNYNKFFNYQLRFFNEDLQELWSFEYNTKPKSKKHESIAIVEYSNNQLSFFHEFFTKKKTEIYFKTIDAKTGQLIRNEKIEGISNRGLNSLLSPLSNMLKRNHEDNSIIVAGIKDTKKHNVNGFFLANLNHKTNQFSYQVFDFKSELAPKIDAEIHKYGTINKLELNPRDVLIDVDGSFKLVAELSNDYFSDEDRKMLISKVSDLYLLQFDTHLQFKEVDWIEKDELQQKRSNYYFSQRIGDNKENVVFFHRDKIEDKQTGDETSLLYINTFQNNKLIQDQFKLSAENEDFKIYPFVAKSGYILLHEFDGENDKNTIRLERLNLN